MIVKGKSRSGPAQLAAYLLRQDGKERPVLVELLDGGQDLHKAFLAWHAIGEGTRGEHTLYHAQIAPENRYDMTPAQWKRAAEILAEELGMKDHPRAIVVHEGHKNPHAHVVFQRADGETMTLWDDGFNYVKHERASARMEREFNMEPVPGKHAKRDREKQPEFPRAEMTEDEAQRQKRTGLDIAARKAEILALYRSADSGQALRAALEQAGYVLARGDRGYVVVDQAGGQSVLTRNTGLRKKDLEAFMAGVPLGSLPTVEEAKDLQRARRAEIGAGAPAPKTEVGAEARTEEAKTAETKTAAGPPALEPAKPGVEASKFAMPADAPPPPDKPAPQPARDEKLEALEKALAERQAEELKKHRDLHALEVQRQEYALDRELKDKLARFEKLQDENRRALQERHAEHRTGLQGFLDALKLRLNPTLAAEQARQRRQEALLLEKRLEQERKDYLALLRQTRDLEIDNLKERQARQLRDLDAKNAEDRERYVREYRESQRFLEQLKEEQRRMERDRERGIDPPARSK